MAAEFKIELPLRIHTEFVQFIEEIKQVHKLDDNESAILFLKKFYQENNITIYSPTNSTSGETVTDDIWKAQSLRRASTTKLKKAPTLADTKAPIEKIEVSITTTDYTEESTTKTTNINANNNNNNNNNNSTSTITNTATTGVTPHLLSAQKNVPRSSTRELTDSYFPRAKPKKETYKQLSSRHYGKDLEMFIIRHGESEANVQPKIYERKADHSMSLSEKGRQQALAVGKYLKEYYESFYGKRPANWKCKMWVSPFKRTRQTAELIFSALGDWVTDIQEDVLLIEQQFGLFEGINWASGEVDELFPKELTYYNKCAMFGGRFYAKLPMGESRFDVCLRASQVLQQIQDDVINGFNNVLIVTHGVTFRALIMRHMQYTPEWFEEESNPGNCSARLIKNFNDLGYIWPRNTGREGKDKQHGTNKLLFMNRESQQSQQSPQELQQSQPHNEGAQKSYYPSTVRRSQSDKLAVLVQSLKSKFEEKEKEKEKKKKEEECDEANVDIDEVDVDLGDNNEENDNNCPVDLEVGLEARICAQTEMQLGAVENCLPVDDVKD